MAKKIIFSAPEAGADFQIAYDNENQNGEFLTADIIQNKKAALNFWQKTTKIFSILETGIVEFFGHIKIAGGLLKTATTAIRTWTFPDKDGTVALLSDITGGGVTSHAALTGLNTDDHIQYALLAGRTGGQTLIGGTGTTDKLILRTTSGIGTTGADIIFQVGNGASPTEAMRIFNDANISIGTQSNNARLSVEGNYTVTGIKAFEMTRTGVSSANAYFRITNGTDQAGQFMPIFDLQSNYESIGTTIGGFFIGRPLQDDGENDVALRFDGRTHSNAQLLNAAIAEFSTLNNVKVRFMANGNVDVMKQIACPLIIGGTGTTDKLTLRSTSGIGTTGADIVFQVGINGTTEAMRITNAGWFGFGENNPSVFCQMRRDANDANTRYQLKNLTSGSAAQTLFEMFSDANGTSLVSYSSQFVTNGVLVANSGRLATSGSGGLTLESMHALGKIILVTGGFAAANERMRITANGDIGIGTTTPKARLHGTGSTILGASTAAVADTDIGNGQCNIYINEVSHLLTFKVKYSSGIIKTGTVALI